MKAWVQIIVGLNLIGCSLFPFGIFAPLAFFRGSASWPVLAAIGLAGSTIGYALADRGLRDA